MSARTDFRCPTCGYGVAGSAPPQRCPMCSSDGERWLPWPRPASPVAASPS